MPGTDNLTFPRAHAPSMPATSLQFPTPIAPLEVTATEHGLQRLRFLPGAPPTQDKGEAPPVLRPVVDALDAYLSGDTDAPLRLPLDVEGTAFQRRVWEALRTIPAGETRTYGEVARTVGRPRAARAVGQAVGANPVPIAVPCHRVLPATGGLGGWSGGVDCKEDLLQHEGVPVPAAPDPR